MYDTLASTLSLWLFIAVPLGIPYTGWVIYSVYKKRWRQVGFQTAIPLVVLPSLYGVFLFAADKADEKAYAEAKATELAYWRTLFDVEVPPLPVVFEYSSPEHFLGDGYWFAIYELPSAVRQRFEDAPVEHWHAAPVNEDPELLKFELRTDSEAARDSPEYERHLEDVRYALTRTGTFYRLDGDSSNWELYVVTLSRGRIFKIRYAS